jgi:hypothetical protein
MTNQLTIAFAIAVASGSAIAAQTKPTQAEIDAWKKDPAPILESSPCKKITWLLESEGAATTELPRRSIRYALGWWGRGFVEGAVYILGDKAATSANDFGLSVEVVSAHIATYCYDHQTETPADAIQHLLLKVLK